jgi:hypothetical protein
MSVIKPRTRGKRLVKHRTRLDQENNETLYAYAQFQSESTEYVLNELVDTVLAKDKAFVRWRADHPQSCVPRPVVRHQSDAHRPETTPARPLGSLGVRSVS